MNNNLSDSTFALSVAEKDIVLLSISNEKLINRIHQ